MNSEEALQEVKKHIDIVENSKSNQRASRPKFPHKERISKALVEADTPDILIIMFIPLFLVISLMDPRFEVAYIFTIALVLSLFTRSMLARLMTILFTAGYFVVILLVGSQFEISGIFNLIFGINTVSLVPVAIGVLMVILVVVSGLLHGSSGHTNYAGLWIVALAFILSIADTLVAVYILALPEWYITFAAQSTIYLTAFVISWGIFYLTSRLIRYGVKSALR